MNSSPAIMLISDLHLPPSGLLNSDSDSNESLAVFSNFVEEKVLGAGIKHLVILGDLFEYWFESFGSIPPEFKDACALFSSFCKRGVNIYVQRGNRDFLLGNAFIRATGAKLLPDTVSLKQDGHSVLLTHGDLLVSGDRRYLFWRWISRSSLFKSIVAMLPASIARRIAGGLRATSKLEKSVKTMRSMTFAESALAHIAQDGYELLIAGHTHIPGEQVIGSMKVITLGAWENSKTGSSTILDNTLQPL